MLNKIYRVDAFINKVYRGNPACVVALREWLDDEVLLKIAKKNAVAETAFFINEGKNIHLRWFTPDLEMDLCGHATLATAYVLRTVFKCSLDDIIFKTLSGSLKVSYSNNIYYLDLPARKPQSALLPKEIELSLNIQPQEVFRSRDYMLVYRNQQEIQDIKINRFSFDRIDLGCGGVIVTSMAESVDFVSRFFTPKASILEDPVTGSSHCTLIPFWSSRLNKRKLEAIQISKRGGALTCQDSSSRVLVGGRARLDSINEFFL